MLTLFWLQSAVCLAQITSVTSNLFSHCTKQPDADCLGFLGSVLTQPVVHEYAAHTHDLIHKQHAALLSHFR